MTMSCVGLCKSTGTMKYGDKEGYGKYVWVNGDTYEGNWKNNRFEGGGTFTHHTVLF